MNISRPLIKRSAPAALTAVRATSTLRLSSELNERNEKLFAETLILSENGFSGQTDMGWREVLISLRIAIYGLPASAIVLALFRAFLDGHLV